MHLAINYSPSAARLVQSGQMDIDYFKTPDWDWLIDEAAQIKPVVVHFTLEAGNDSIGEVDWKKVSVLSQLTGTPFINLHLDAKQSYYPGFNVDTEKVSEVEKVFDIILSDIKSVVARFGPEQVIIENSPYQGDEGNSMRLCVMPDMITRTINETGVGLLLDISHAIISAKSLNMDPVEYISQLPVGQLKELHFAGIQRDLIAERWMDHLSIQESDWHWLEWILDHIRSGEWDSPWLLAFEYGGVGEPFEWRTDPQVIAEQVPQLYERIKVLKD